MNRKAEELLGVPFEHIISRRLEEFYPRDEPEFYREILEKCAEIKQGSKVKCFVIHKDGHKIPVEISSSLNEAGGEKISMGIFRDITAFQEERQALTKSREELRELVARKTEEALKMHRELEDTTRLFNIKTLTGMIAHELRNPLGVIKIATYNIKREVESPSVNNHVLDIDNKVDEIDRIIKNLLNFARVNMPKYEKILCRDFMAECLDGIKHKYEGWNVEVKKTCCNETDFFEADKVQMAEVITNILDNAYEAISERRGLITIDGDYSKEGNKFDIIIRDSGAGIEKQKLEKIFEPFFTTKPRGVDLGLAICRQIVNLHGGTITIESEKGKGSAVFVSLPIKR